jgi:hypothetical protein
LENFDMETKTERPERLREPDVVSRARELINSHSCFYPRASHFQFELTGDVLVVHGRLPSFHLKQLLQNVLARLDGVARVDNRVHVVSSVGLSSVGK